MHHTISGKRRLLAVAAAVVGLTVLSACGSSAAPSTGGTRTTGDPASTTATVGDVYAGTDEAPPATGPAPKKGINLWVVSCSAHAVGCQAPAEAAKQAGSLLGWKVTVADGQFGVGDGYNVAIRQAVAAKADAIALIGVQCADSRGGLEDAKSAGIPVIGIYSFDCAGSPLFTATMQMNSKNPDLKSWLTAYGAMKADWLIKATHGKAVVIDSMLTTSPTATVPQAGFDAELKAKCPACKIAATVDFADQDLQTGAYAQKFASTLVAHPEANAIDVPLDTFIITGNIPAAVAATGRKITIIGGEGLAPTVALVRSGQVAAFTGFSTGWEGYGLIDTVNRVLNHQQAVPEGIGYKNIDATQTLPPKGQGYETTVDYESAYKKLWRVQ